MERWLTCVVQLYYGDQLLAYYSLRYDILLKLKNLVLHSKWIRIENYDSLVLFEFVLTATILRYYFSVIYITLFICWFPHLKRAINYSEQQVYLAAIKDLASDF